MSRVYLYGFVPADARLPDGGLLGLGDGVVELVEAGGVAAVVSPVDDPAMDDDAIQARSADLEWMAEQGLRHEQVVAWFVDHATILPSRLLTLFSGRDAVRAAAERDGGRIHATLERLAGVREWNLKVAYDPRRLAARLADVSETIAELDREIETAGPGKRFLLRKKRDDLARTEARDAARRMAAALLERLEPLASDSRRVTPPVEEAPVLLNVAFLVPRGAEPELTERARRAEAEWVGLGVSVQLTGPWAPYRFLESDG